MFVTLSYHIINRAIRDKIAISEEAFEQQLNFLREHGYTTLSLDQAVADIDGKQQAPPRSLLLTFDDGYIDNARVALPLLQACNMRATLFVITGFVGQTNRWNHRASYDVHHMTWDDLRLWLDSGCDIGGHSHLHYNMTRLSAGEMQETILVNKRLLEEELAFRLRAFAYPYGAFNPAIIDAIHQHYEIAFATEKGSWDASTHRYTINRLTISPAWDIAEFARQLHAINLDGHTLAEPN
ncbi:MAG TPA: polysaccharide deacetylase family protein [Ktedonobacteraceae bacterium]|nr:polysaccharide deacetylase family protein [Ktedonobacteraceae bacterium]